MAVIMQYHEPKTRQQKRPWKFTEPIKKSVFIIFKKEIEISFSS
jgi:hypothetical protein